jgi:hypothetical protein
MGIACAWLVVVLCSVLGHIRKQESIWAFYKTTSFVYVISARKIEVNREFVVVVVEIGFQKRITTEVSDSSHHRAEKFKGNCHLRLHIKIKRHFTRF